MFFFVIVVSLTLTLMFTSITALRRLSRSVTVGNDGLRICTRGFNGLRSHRSPSSSASFLSIRSAKMRVSSSLSDHHRNKNEEDQTSFFGHGDIDGFRHIDRDAFLFGNENRSFADLGVQFELIDALRSCKKEQPTTIQAKAFEFITRGEDVVIGSETGSGKTLSYLVPLFQLLLKEQETRRSRTPTSSSSASGHEDKEIDSSPSTLADESLDYPMAVIMCPTKELCAQVQRMVEEVTTSLMELHSLEITCAVFSQQMDRWPYSSMHGTRRSSLSPMIMICTPSVLSNFVRGPNILEPGLFRNLQALILDEADMLLEGSYLPHVERVLEALKLIRREMIQDGIIDINDKILQTILVAATLPSYGLRSIDQYIHKRFPLAKRVNNEYLHKHHPRIQQEFIEAEEVDLLKPSRVKLVVDAIVKGAMNPITAAAVVAGVHASDSEAQLPAQVSIAGVGAKAGGLHDAASLPQTMVFVNTAEAARALTEQLRLSLGDDHCCEYHKLVIDPEKQENLRRFRDGETAVLVCTDSAARGLDLPGVRLVVQAEFALNVVQHLHRVGRASRAGVLGAATNIFDSRSADLVRSILSDKDDKRVDQSFSRRRGFRQKLKKIAKREST